MRGEKNATGNYSKGAKKIRTTTQPENQTKMHIIRKVRLGKKIEETGGTI